MGSPRLWTVYNGPMPTTAALAPVTTGTAIKTLLQLATPATTSITLISWGISFDGSAAATPIKCELIQTDVAATVTAHVAAGVMSSDPNAPATRLTLGTSATGYTATAEGTITATRLVDYQLVSPMNQYAWQWPLDQEWEVAVSKFLRVRVTAAAAVNAVCWVDFREN